MDAAEPEVPRGALVREVAVASAGIVLLLGCLKHLAALVPLVREHAFTVAAAVQLYVPVGLIGRRGITRETLGLTFARWRADLGAVAVLAVVTGVPFAIGHHFWQTWWLHRTLAPRLPEGLLEDVAVQLGVVALAEELFFRGYLQERMERLWPATRTLLGAPFGRAIVGASVVFALAHFAGEYRVDRLGPFFPGLLFGLLRARTRTIVGSTAYHGLCNLLSDVLWACYR